MKAKKNDRKIEAVHVRMDRLSKQVCNACVSLQKDLGVRKDIIQVYILRFFQTRPKDDLYLAVLIIELRNWYKRELGIKWRNR